VTWDGPGGFVELADVDGDEHPATNRPATTATAIRLIDTTTT